MTRDHTTVWDSCLATIRRNVNDQSFKTWFEPIRPVRLANEALTIQVPNKFFYEWLEEHYVHLLKSTIREELGTKGRLEYQILMGRNGGENKSAEAERTSPIPAPDAGFVAGSQIKNPFVIPGIKRLKLSLIHISEPTRPY